VEAKATVCRSLVIEGAQERAVSSFSAIKVVSSMPLVTKELDMEHGAPLGGRMWGAPSLASSISLLESLLWQVARGRVVKGARVTKTSTNLEAKVVGVAKTFRKREEKAAEAKVAPMCNFWVRSAEEGVDSRVLARLVEAHL